MTELTARYDMHPILIANRECNARKQVLSGNTCKQDRHEAFREAVSEESSD